ncbi:MAG: LysR family transcriptional regulator [Polyangiales bacterium]|nr:LysR family transcriptional regulator [Myxococcales bacterium]MCB9657907.1 LysR family transcriptional regulator [Sandaracinaceae bacterium]
MNSVYGRDLDLNLLRVFAVVAATGSVTRAAAQLYLTQPAVSAALKRLNTAVGAALFVRQGRGVVLTARGRQLLARVTPHLQPLVDAALDPAPFDPRTSERVLRLGVSDSAESWLLPPLLRVLAQDAPGMRLVVLPVQFRTVHAVFAGPPLDGAVTVADELPEGILREELFHEGFVCLYDPRHLALRRPFTREAYLQQEHVIVSYNGDLRGIIEDVFHEARRVRCSVPSFAHVGALVEGGALLATVPRRVAQEIRRARPALRTTAVPFELTGAPMELLWPRALDDDPASAFVRGHIRRISVRRASTRVRPADPL